MRPFPRPTLRAFLLSTTGVVSGAVPMPASAYGIEATLTMRDGRKGTVIVPFEEAAADGGALAGPSPRSA